MSLKKIASHIYLYASLLLLCLSLSVMLGWATHDLALIQVSPDFAPMQFMTAFTFFLFAVAFLFQNINFSRAAWLISLVIILWTGLVLAQYIFLVNLGIDELLFQYNLDYPSDNPGRMAPNTAFCFFILGWALAFVNSQRTKLLDVTILTICFISISISALALFGYFSGLDKAIGWLEYTGMAIHTAVGIAVIGFAIFVSDYTLYLISPKVSILRLTAAVAIGMVVFVFGGWQSLRAQIYINASKMLENEAQYLQTAISLSFNQAEMAFERIGERWKVLRGYSEELWQVDASNYLVDIKPLSFLGIYNQDFVLVSHLSKRNQKPVPLKKYASEVKLEEVTFFFENSSEGNSIIVVMPLLGATYESKGHLVGSFDINTLIGSLYTPLSKEFNIKLSIGEDILYESIVPDYSLFGRPEYVEIYFGTLQAKLEVFFTEKMNETRSFFTSYFFLVNGIFLSIAVVAAVYFSQVSIRKKNELESALEKLEEATALRTAALENSGYSIIVTDRQGAITLFNKCAENLLGYTSAEVLSQGMMPLFFEKNEVDEYAKKLSDQLQKPLKGGFDALIALPQQEGSEEREWNFITKDKDHIPVSLKGTPLKNVEGETVGFVWAAYDLTEKKRIDLVKNEFIAITSHELKSPLTAISGAADLLKAINQLSPKSEKLLEIISLNCRRLLNLSNDLLDVQKIEMGKMKYDFKELSLANLIKSAAASSEIYAEQEGVVLKVGGASEELHVIGDEHRLLQALANLLNNAIKFSPKGGIVEFVVKEEEGHSVRIEVKDQGLGIPDEFRSKIFQKFARADMPEKYQKKGTGLGLNLTKSIVEQHKGSIGYQARETGTTFWIKLALA